MVRISSKKRSAYLVNRRSDAAASEMDQNREIAQTRSTPETPFKPDADRDFDGRREDSHYMTSTSNAQDETTNGIEW